MEFFNHALLTVQEHMMRKMEQKLTEDELRVLSEGKDIALWSNTFDQWLPGFDMKIDAALQISNFVCVAAKAPWSS